MSLQIKVKVPKGTQMAEADIVVSTSSIGAATALPAHNTEVISQFTSKLVNDIISGSAGPSLGVFTPAASTAATTVDVGEHDNDTESSATATDIRQVDEDSRIQLYVRTLTGKTIPLLVPYFEKVSALKSRIQHSEGIPRGDQRLKIDGMTMSSKDTLDAYDIEDGDVIDLVLEFRGS